VFGIPVEGSKMAIGTALTSMAKALYSALGILTIVTIAVSIQPAIGLRQVRNLTILASYGVGVALLFADRWLRPALVWVAVGAVSGLLYFGYESWTISRARRDRPAEDHGQASLSTILLGVVAWPIALPEVLESALADSGVIGHGAVPPPEADPKER
jgi:hypothetical protein